MPGEPRLEWDDVRDLLGEHEDGCTLAFIMQRLAWPDSKMRRFSKLAKADQIKGVRIDRSTSPMKFKTGESTWNPRKWNKWPRQ